MGRRNEICLYDQNTDDDFRDLMGFVLGDQGFRLSSYMEPEEVVKRARDEGVCLIMIHVTPPFNAGLELARSLRDEPQVSKVPRILITSLHLENKEITDLGTLAGDILYKPFDVGVLLEKISQLTQDR